MRKRARATPAGHAMPWKNREYRCFDLTFAQSLWGAEWPWKRLTSYQITNKKRGPFRIYRYVFNGHMHSVKTFNWLFLCAWTKGKTTSMTSLPDRCILRSTITLKSHCQFKGLAEKTYMLEQRVDRVCDSVELKYLIQVPIRAKISRFYVYWFELDFIYQWVLVLWLRRRFWMHVPLRCTAKTSTSEGEYLRSGSFFRSTIISHWVTNHLLLNLR